MNKYREILILDEFDLPNSNSITLSQFLEIINQHVDNVGKSHDEIFVTIGSSDAYYDEPVSAEIKFWCEK